MAPTHTGIELVMSELRKAVDDGCEVSVDMKADLTLGESEVTDDGTSWQTVKDTGRRLITIRIEPAKVHGRVVTP